MQQQSRLKHELDHLQLNKTSIPELKAAIFENLNEQTRFHKFQSVFKHVNQHYKEHRYEEALKVAYICKDILPENYWERARSEVLKLYLMIGECSFVLGDRAQAFNHLQQAEQYANLVVEKLQLYHIYAIGYRLGENAAELNKIIEKSFSLCNMIKPRNITKFHVGKQYLYLQVLLKKHCEQTLLQLPLLKSEEKRLLVQIIVEAVSISELLDEQEITYNVMRMLQITLQEGFCAESSIIYMKYAIEVGMQFENVKQRQLFKRVAIQMVKQQSIPIKVMIYKLSSIYHTYWASNREDALNDLRQAQYYAKSQPQYLRSHLLSTQICLHIFFQSNSLKQVYEVICYEQLFNNDIQTQVEQQFLFEFRSIVNNLRNGNIQLKINQSHLFKESPTIFSIYNSISLCISFLLDERAQLLDCLKLTENNIKFPSILRAPNTHLLYQALVNMEWVASGEDDKRRMKKNIEQTLNYFKHWSKVAPTKFQHNYHFLLAEQFHYQGYSYEAIRHYERAWSLAKSGHYIIDAVIVMKRLATFYKKQGDVQKSERCMNEACMLLKKWGATSILQICQQEGIHHQFKSEETEKQSFQMKLIMDAMNSLTTKIRMRDLVQELLHIMLKQTNATKVHFIRVMYNQAVLISTVETNSQQFVFHETGVKIEEHLQPLIDFVIRSEEPLVSGNVQKSALLVNRKHVAKSLLCLPVFNKGQMRAILYLENALYYDAFDDQKLQILSLISTQLAISMDNAEIYEELERRVDERTKMYEDTNDYLTTVNEQLYEKEKAQKLLFEGVSHQLRSPVTTALGYIEVILDNVVTDKIQQMQYVERSKERLLQLQQLINQIFQLVEIEGSRIHFQYEIVNVNEWFKQFVKQLPDIVRSEEIIVYTSTFDICFKADLQHFQFAIHAMIQHFIEHFLGAPITLRATIDHRILLLHIEQTASEVDDEMLNSMFEAYFLAAKKQAVPMTGIELAICKKIIELHQGDIRMTRAGEKGVRFTIALPLIEANNK